jgi:glyoxylase-like metal-dependent hydrolase (beta-lactamase superfamily II)
MRTASPWFRTVPVTSTLTRIDEPHADDLVRANLWHLRGRDRDLVFDTGLGVASLRQQLPQLFERDPIVVLSHAHFDHTGGAHEFDQCWAHPADAFEDPAPAFLDGPKAMASLGLATEDLGFPVAETLVHAVPHDGYDTAAYRARAPRIGRWIGEGDIVDLGDRQLTVLHLPGHTPGSIVLFDESDGTTFSGDVLYDGELLDTCHGADRASYVESLQRLRGLPVSMVHAGHEDSFGPDRMRHLIDAYTAAAI